MYMKKDAFITDVKCALIGIGAGAVNGMFGSGGGLLLVPLFSSLEKVKEKRAFATSVFTVLFLSLASIFFYSKTQSVEISTLLSYVIGGTTGGIAGAFWFKKIPIIVVRRIFALFILWAAIKAIFS
jgi:uncharacterized membrane protein YfcA